jgi:hypothetical protein
MSTPALCRTIRASDDLTFSIDYEVVEMLGVSWRQLKMRPIQTPPQGRPVNFFAKAGRESFRPTIFPWRKLGPDDHGRCLHDHSRLRNITPRDKIARSVKSNASNLMLNGPFDGS